MISTVGASWVLDGSGSWLESHRLRLRDGVIETIEQCLPGEADSWWEGGTLLPAFVNMHCHLELGAAQGQLPRGVPMPAWVEALQGLTARWAREDWEQGALRSARELLASGCATVFDVGNGPHVPRMVERKAFDGLRVLPHREFMGLRAEGLQERMMRLEAEGVSVPWCLHAPYSCSEALVKAVVFREEAGGRRVAIHFAESREEEELFRTGGGAWERFLSARGLPLPPGVSEAGWPLLADHRRWLLVHGNLLGPEWDTLLQRQGHALIVCPSSRTFFGHPKPPVAHWLAAGIPVALGTDSLASTVKLDLWAELAQLGAEQELSWERLFPLATREGADLLDLPTGRLAEGCWADLQVVAGTDLVRQWQSVPSVPTILSVPTISATPTAPMSSSAPGIPVAHPATPRLLATWVGGRCCHDASRSSDANGLEPRPDLT